MPSRKQRRRQQKLRRHEWEEVWVDAEGRELDPDETPEEDERPARRESRASANGKPRSKAPAKKQPRTTGAGRVVQPPSWRRVFKRGLIFAPIMFLVVYFLKPKDATTASLVFQVAILLVFFVPFSYVMDVLMYRGYQRRSGAAAKKR